MLKKIAVRVFLLLSLCLFFSPPASADWTEFLQYFTFPGLDPDPRQPDTVYTVCSELTMGTQVIEVRLRTDNQGRTDSIAGIYVPLIITADMPGVVLDTTHAATFGGTDIASWSFLSVGVESNMRNPSLFPMKLLFGGADNHPVPHTLADGDFLLANLTFHVIQPANICIDTTSQMATGLPLLVTTAYTIEYRPKWRAICCYASPTVPTLSEWGLIVFGVLLLSGVVFFLKKRRRA